jgi:hypothetical protein
MPYTQYTRSQFKSEVLQSMRAGSYWSGAEVDSALNEALLYWGALTSYWRERGSFSAGNSIPYYDLSIELPGLRARTYTLGTLTQEIQYALQEPASGVSGAGMTTQFSIDQFVNALIRSRNQFVLDSRLPYSINSPIPLSSPPAGRTALPDEIALIGHASWGDESTGIIYPLRREDGWSEDSANPLWTLEPSIPFAYSMAETRPVEIQFYPIPLAAGTLELIAVQTIPMAVADGTLFQVPNEFAFAIKYLALSSLLSTQNEGFDPLRAKYSMERYQQLIAISQSMRSVIRVQVNDRPIPLDTLSNLDAMRPTWRNIPGETNYSACIYDILALSNLPNQTIGITCDVVRSAPLPPSDADYIQVGREEISYLMDYVRHILCFKIGGSEFVATMPLYDRFLSAATQRNSLLAIKARYMTPLFGQSAYEESNAPAA